MYKKYKNLIKDHVPTRSEQLWLSYITYITTKNGHNHISIIRELTYQKDNNLSSLKHNPN
ncbi:hypothetical protein SAMN04488096_10118 [Mesonia phycicola]|uniref:Uncharacterized protein n=1 Tax=Mesonia phycicola TaxID=579105 RepID=A0A1M6A221_9FLAO|nr:hypothetical protein SAMN04488096_10118 [Mesonia phycicola]